MAGNSASLIIDIGRDRSKNRNRESVCMKRKFVLVAAMAVAAMFAAPVVAQACDSTKSDEFTAGTLDGSKWSFPYAGSGTPYFSAGHLVFQIASDGIEGTAEGNMNLVAQAVPAGTEWTVETKITSNVLADDGVFAGYTQVGMMLFRSTANWIRVGHTRIGVYEPDPVASPAGSGTYFEMAHETNNIPTYPQRAGVSPSNPMTWWFQMRRNGDTITSYYALTDPSGNPGAWLKIPGDLSIATVLPGSEPLYIGLHNGVGGLETASYDYFRVICPGPPADVTPPAVSHQIVGDEQVAGVYSGPVQVQLTATDAVGVTSHEYRINGGAWTTYSAPVALSAAGSYTVDYRAGDAAGNSGTGSASFQIVASAPVLSAKLAKKTVTLKANKKNAKLTLSVTNTGGDGQVTVCAKAPKSKLKVQGGACKTITIAAGQTGKVTIKLKAQKKLKGKSAKVTITTTADGASKLTTKGTIKQKKK